MTPSKELLHRFAEQAFLAGRPDVAGQLLRLTTHCHSAQPIESAEQLHQQALKCLKATQPQQAEALLLRAIQQQPMNAAWHEHLGVALAQQKRYAEAANTFRVALRLDANRPHCWHQMALAYSDAGNIPAALGACREAIQRDPNTIDYPLQLIQILRTGKLHDEALAEARALTVRQPTVAAAWTALGLLLAEQLSFADACGPFQKAVELQPESAETQSNLAAVLGKLKRYDECEQAARIALKLNPNHATAWGNLGNCLRDRGQYDEAIPALERCLKLNPHDADAAGNLALTWATLGRHDAALEWYDKSLTLKPANGEMAFNRSLTYLTLGDYARGWPGYESRWQTDAMRGTEPKYPVPRWQGQPLPGKSIFLVAEQGLGDYIQFIRFARQIQALGMNVLVQPPAGLAELIRTVPGITDVIEQPNREVGFHVQAPLLSIPGLLQIDARNITGEPYLTAPTSQVVEWKQRLQEVHGIKVGLAWQGNPKHGGDKWRSVPLSMFAGLARVNGVSLVSLQKGEGREQLDACGFPIADYGPDLQDFAATAGLMRNLDLVIAVDTAIVHLAGALGVMVWNVIAFNNDWRWLKGRSDSPWYGSMTLFRQPKIQDWAGAFAAVEDALRRMVSQYPKSSRS